MKKLMFGAALAATSMAFAATPEGQVYDVCLSIKSTAACKATINNKTNPFLGEEKEEVIYRKQASYTWKGLIWGCSCEAIDGVWEEANQGELIDYSSVKGCILWDTKAKTAVFIGNGADLNDPEDAADKGFGWDFLNAIDKNGKKVEGSWEMTQEGTLCDDPATLFAFRGAGFGTLCLGGTDEDACALNYIKSISGNFAGWMVAPDETSVVNPTGCTFCGYEEGSSTCMPSAAWDYCSCEDDLFDDTRTAAYGTWSVKYNSSLSQKLSKPLSISSKGVEGVIVSITDVYNFKSLPLVAAKITAIENAIWDYDPTGCDELETALAKAKATLKEAEAAAEAVSDDVLKDKALAAQAAYQLSLTNNAAYVSVTNYFGTDAAWVGVKPGYKTEWVVTDPVHGTKELVQTLDFDATVAANYAYYGDDNGTSNKLVNADVAYTKAICQQTNVNATIVWKNGSLDEVTNKVVGCTAIEAFVLAHNDYTLIEMKTVTPGVVGEEGTYKTWAECTALVKKLTDETEAAAKALEKAEAANVAARAAFKVIYDAIAVAAEAQSTAVENWDNRVALQTAAAAEVTVATAAVETAQKAYDDAGCED